MFSDNREEGGVEKKKEHNLKAVSQPSNTVGVKCVTIAGAHYSKRTLPVYVFPQIFIYLSLGGGLAETSLLSHSNTWPLNAISPNLMSPQLRDPRSLGAPWD